MFSTRPEEVSFIRGFRLANAALQSLHHEPLMPSCRVQRRQSRNATPSIPALK
jgi:hypothetical protein